MGTQLKVARVSVDGGPDKLLDYSIPAALSGQVNVGSRVTVPLGRARRPGYVMELSGKSEFHTLKPIDDVVGTGSFLTPKLLELADWVSSYYLATREQVLRAFLPAAVRRKGQAHLSATMVSLSDESDESADLSEKQMAVVDAVRSAGSIELADLLKQCGCSQSPVKTLEKKGILTLAKEDKMRDPLAGSNILRTKHLELMPEQQSALDDIEDAVNGCEESGAKRPPHVILLYGVTGSGKTEVYLQAIDRVLSQGKGAIVLVPEIALTPQTVERFVGRFGARTAVLHSRLSDGERHDEWHRIREGNADIVVGARSAVFAPLQNLGLIVVDEEHENSYKQEDVPRYSARDVAVMRGYIEKCPVVLGSATPSLESWKNAKAGKYILSILPKRADDRRMPSMRVIDMRLPVDGEKKRGILSKDLVEAIRTRLERAEQVILFLNRRGFSSSLMCPSCGFVASCENCSVSYTYHRSEEALMCHLCGDSRKVPQKCPGCSDPAFKYSGIGTQRVESVVKACFPHATVERMDADVTRRKHSHAEILGAFRSGKTDILIGTQMIAKGLHFPNVTLVGVVFADLSLHMPDFRAGERTFQLLAQVAGRAGRGEVAGEVIVQTYTPFHAAIQAARKLEFEKFCDEEMEFRKELMYPPFGHLVCVLVRGKSETKVSFLARTISVRLKKIVSEGVRVAEAVPAPISKIRSEYRYHVILRAKSAASIQKAIRAVMADLKLPDGVACSVDIDAVSLM